MQAGQFIMKCFHARTAAHVLHLKTTSYAQHKALQKFYEQLIDLIDSYAESYQGCNGLIEDYGMPYRQFPTPVALLEDLKEWIEDNRQELYMKHQTALSNVVDEIEALIGSTLYKVKVLK